MTCRGTLVLSLACALPLACSAAGHLADDAAAAVVAEGAESPWPELAFGELRSERNSVDSARLPIEQRALRELGNRALLPPRSRRGAWQPRLAGALEFDDNLLLAPRDFRSGTALLVSPGLNWQHEGARHRVEVDASLDVAQGVAGDDETSRIDGAAFLGSAIGRVSETVGIEYFGVLLRSHDPAGSTPVGPVVGNTDDQRFSTTYQRHEAGLRWRAGPRTDLTARWIGTLADSRSPDYVRTRSQDVELGAHWQLTPTRRVGLLLRERHAAFDTEPSTRSSAAWVELAQQWGPTWLGKAAVGAARSRDGSGLAVWRASLSKTYARGQWDLSIERDVSVPVGLGRSYELRSASFGTTWRLGHRSQIEVAVIASEYSPLDSVGGFAVRTIRPRLSYTLPFAADLWFNLRYQRIEDRALDTDLRRQGDRVQVTVVKTF